jgi:hypothetical protein
LKAFRQYCERDAAPGLRRPKRFQVRSERLAHECRFKPKLAQFFIERRVRGIENPWSPVVLTRMVRLDSMAHVVPEPIA